MSDVKILYTFILFFIVTGLITSFVSSELSGESEEFDTNKIIDDSKTEIELKNSLSIFTVLLNIVKMASWSFGTLPILFDLVIMVPIRLAFWYLAIKTILGGGS